MPHEIGVLVIHGMGVQANDRFAEAFIEKVTAHLRERGAEREVAWAPCYWADLLNERQRELWRKVRGDELRWGWMRRFLIDYFADAVAYQRRPSAADDVYRQVHTRVRDCLGVLRARLGDADRPIAVVAHSLGSVIVSNYIWDHQHPRGDGPVLGRNPLERMETLAGMVTMGSNIPLFTLALDRIDAIDFPPRALPAHLRGAARWYNYLDRDDVLAYPLRGLSASYECAVAEDRFIGVGGVAAGWNPASHAAYWTDRRFTREVAAQLVALWRAARRGVAAGGSPVSGANAPVTSRVVSG